MAWADDRDLLCLPVSACTRWALGTPPSQLALSNRAIAEGLVITEHAVEKHVTSIFSKLDLPQASDHNRRVLAVLAYLRA